MFTSVGGIQLRLDCGALPYVQPGHHPERNRQHEDREARQQRPDTEGDLATRPGDASLGAVCDFGGIGGIFGHGDIVHLDHFLSY